jgi:uncharacterized protein (TIGR00725 family)
MHIPRVAVIGSGDCDNEVATEAEALGAGIAALGAELVCGGRGGVMAAACRGAQGAGGRTIGILPDGEREAANAWIDVPVATGLGPARNALVPLNGDVVVAIRGGAGTLTELGFAAIYGRPVIGLGTHDLPSVQPARDVEHALELVQKALREQGFEA